ncbi:MAG: Y-family DNA polymerase [Panacagrimonas sp.]
MLWLCLHFPRLPASALGSDSGELAVVDQRGSQRWLITGTPDCHAGISLSQAFALIPELRVQVRKPSAEQVALQSLAYWAYRYGQPVTAEIQDLAEPGRIPRALLWVEIGQSLELFDGLEALRDELCSGLLELGHVAQLAIAPTRAAAALLACAGRSDPVMDLDGLGGRLADLPLRLLHWPNEVLSALSGVGLQRLGDLLAIPREAFTRRFDAKHRLALDRLLGMAAEPCEAIVPPETFRRRFELTSEVEDVERLQFPLKRLCSELQAYLRARDCGLRSVTLAVAHAGARETRIHARFVDPHRDAGRIFDALRERLERDGLPLPARELMLMAEDFAEAVVPQNDLFDSRAAQTQAWAAAIERIQARLGESRVWTPRAVEDHRPERAIHRDLPGVGAGHTCDGIFVEVLPAADCRGHGLLLQPLNSGPRPTFLLPQPWPMPPPELPADTCFERIESGWWDAHDVRRDYTTLDVNGGRAWVFREVNGRSWYLHGWWS